MNAGTSSNRDLPRIAVADGQPLNKALALKTLKEKLLAVAQEQALADFNEIKGEAGESLSVHVSTVPGSYFKTPFLCGDFGLGNECSLFFFTQGIFLGSQSIKTTLRPNPKSQILA